MTRIFAVQSFLKVTRHLCCKDSKNPCPLDILAWNPANKPSLSDGLLAELQARMSR